MNNPRRFLTQSFTRFCMALALLVWLGALSVRAETFYVATNGNHTTFTNWTTAATNIQAAVDVATNTGDIVLVSNGVYTTTTGALWGSWTNIVALTNRITLKSVNGPAGTVIDANFPAQQRRGVFVSQNATLDGFTVRNGYVNYLYARGGGILVAAPGGGTVTNCIVHNNFGGDNGGGISFSSASNSIAANCTIYSNSCRYSGGGLETYWMPDTSNMINNCVFWRNRTTAKTSGHQGGGGLFSYVAFVSVKNCLFYQNVSHRYGGGGAVSYISSRVVVLENCTIVSNAAADSGGGFLWKTRPLRCATPLFTATMRPQTTWTPGRRT